MRYVWKLLFFLFSLVGVGVGQSALSNGSACAGLNSPTSGCNVAFAGFGTNPSNTGAETLLPSPIPTNISTASLRNLLYSGATSRIVMHYMPWFCNTSSPCNGHKNIGMNENNTNQVNNQLQFMFSIGVNVVDIDYYGNKSTQAFNLATTNAVNSLIAVNPANYPTLMLTLDGGAINGTGTGQCPPASGDQSACLISAINGQLDYMAANYLYKTWYEKDTATGSPIVPLFITKSQWPGTSFTTVYNAVHTHIQSGSCGVGCTYIKPVKLLDENAGAFSESGIDGGFAWIQPPTYSNTNQFCWDSSSCGGSYLGNFYSTAKASTGKITMGVVYKGFDDFPASWGSNRVIAEQCGQVLNLSAEVINSNYSMSTQLQYVQFSTWNDYEEGSELETGIDNCISISNPTNIAGTISWSLIKSDTTYATTATISSLAIYTGPVGGPNTLYVGNLSPSTTSYAAPAPALGQYVYIYANGTPLIQNRLSAGVSNPIIAPPCTPLAYCAYTGTDIVIPSTMPPNLGGLTKNGAVVYDTSYQSHGLPSAQSNPLSRCTDQAFMPTNGLKGFSAGQGGAGEGVMWNTDSSLIHIVTNGGNSAIALFNTVTMACSASITADKNLTHPGSSANFQPFGDGQFSLNNPNRWWAFGAVGNDILSKTQVTPFTFNTSTGTFTEDMPITDFKYGLPIGTNAPEWQANHTYSFGNYISHTMVPGEFFTYQSNYAGFQLGDIIWPGYPTGCGFVLKKVGTTGATPPNWTTTTNCGSNANSITDGTATWRTLVGPAKFVFQLISNGGVSGVTLPAFVPVNKHPDIVSQVNDNGLTWENVGVNVSTPVWGSLTNVSLDDTKFSKGWSIATYGADPSSLGGSNGSCVYANCSGDQGTGGFVVSYDASGNIYHLINTLTSIQSDITCVGGNGFACVGGSLLFTTPGAKLTGIPCPFYLHDSYGFKNGINLVLAVQSSFLGVGCPSTTTPFVWFPYQTFNATTQIQAYASPQSHTAHGYTHTAFVGQDVSNYGYQSGAYGLVVPTSDIGISPYPISWQAAPCDTVSPAVWFPGDAIEPCQLEMDQHLSWAFNPGDDSTPVCGTFYNNVLANANGPIPVAAYQGEVVCFTTSPTWTSTSTPNINQKQWRFAHTFETQSNISFNIQFEIGQLSQDGRFYAFGTDWGGQFGSTTGVAPVLPIPNSSVTCLGGYLWQSNFAYPLGAVINPVPSLNGGGTPYHVYQAISVTGVSGSVAPAWASTSVGTNITDGGVVWQDLGVGNCRGDVVVVQLGGPYTLVPPPPSPNSVILNGVILSGGSIR